MKKTNNKGFSLVELIIVIAIMAILIGVLAPQYMKYVDKSRVSADKDLLDAVYGACTTAWSDPDLTLPTVTGTGWYDITSTVSGVSAVPASAATTWEDEVIATLKYTLTDVNKKLKSNAMKGKSIKIEVDELGNFRVSVTGATDPGATAAGATFTDYCVPQQY